MQRQILLAKAVSYIMFAIFLLSFLYFTSLFQSLMCFFFFCFFFQKYKQHLVTLSENEIVGPSWP